jgi:AcrR family transcriptional regulator
LQAVFFFSSNRQQQRLCAKFVQNERLNYSPVNMSKDTRTLILDTAEALFAEQGYDGTSMRLITSKAKVNLASINYHFGSKHALLEAVYDRRIGGINAERLVRLEQLEKIHSKSVIPVSDLVEAYARPALKLARDNTAGGKYFIRLLGRSYLEPSPVLQDRIREMYEGVSDRFRAAFVKALPDVSPQDLYWRLHFMVGVIAFCMTGTDMMRMIASSKIQDNNDFDQLMQRLVTFVSHGLMSPVEQDNLTTATTTLISQVN